MTNTITAFLAHLKSLDVQLSVEGDRSDSPDTLRLRCTAPEGILTEELRQQLSDRKAELLTFFQDGQSLSPFSTAPIQPTVHKSIFPLSFAQQRLWFLSQLEPDNPFYNIPAAIRLNGRIDRDALEQAFNIIVSRHDALRTTFSRVDGQPVQAIAPEVKIPLATVDLQSIPEAECDRVIQQLTTAEAQRPFNLQTDPLLRVTLLQVRPTESILLLTLHHIVADGWSLGVLNRELAAIYTALVQGRAPALPALPIQYPDFACWQRDTLQGDVLEAQLSYWRSQLQGLSPLELMGDRPRPAAQTYRGATYPISYSPVLTGALEALSQREGTSLFMTLLAAFQTLLYRYTGEDDIAIGSPIANRHRSELEGLIGFFVNSLVLRTDLSGNPTFRELLGRVRSVALEAYAHQDLPFEKLVEELEPERDLSRNPLFQIGFALQNAPMQPLELPGATLEPVHLEPGTTRFDLEVHLWEPSHGLRSLWQSQDGLSGFVSYSEDLFDRSTIGRLVGHLQTLLEGIVADPDAHLSELPLLTATERQQLLLDWNPSPLAPAPLGFHQIFEAQAHQRPDAIALIFNHEALTYADLNQRADRLAQTLRQRGVQQNTLVGLCVERSPDLLIGILGILKAGGAYVPLDPKYPSDRLQFMLTDTRLWLLLTQSWLVDALPKSQAQILCLDQPLPESLQSAPLPSTVTTDQLAYVIYTSGSTGTPKGVLLTHQGLCNVVAAQRQTFQLSPDSRVLQFSSLSFDASIFEIALAFGSGSTLYIPPPAAQLPGVALIQFLQEQAITHALITPAVLSVLPSAELPALQMLITGGEACPANVVDRWAANHRFFNAYGPTETTIWATIAELRPGDNPLNLGRPILNTQLYLLDAAFNPVPIGVAGELYIGGAGLAQGYLHRPELTAERFVRAQDLKLVEGKVYRTGDRARYRSDGTLEFLGRIDHQIKIRGFRVELGEIEATLHKHPALQDAAVVTAHPAPQETRLIAYFSLDQDWLEQNQNTLQTQHINHWQTLYNQTYQPDAVEQNDFNIIGWNSSYTGEPIPLEQMQEWVDDRVHQVLNLRPERVLEIGCGTGLLLFQIAPHCHEYWGTDFSAVSLDFIRRQWGDRTPSIKLLQRTATDFHGIPAATFDVVILNSVVQYFPSTDYLLQVLEGAVKAIAPGGVLFLGDVRSLPLLTAFHAAVQFSQAETGIDRVQLRHRVERACFEDPELVIDPVFFTALSDRIPQIRQVQIRLARGHSVNEMTQFRYNVLLHVGEEEGARQSPKCQTQPALQWLNWQQHPATVAEIVEHLQKVEPEVFGITGITNSRISTAVKITKWLLKDESPKTVGRMQELLQNSVERAIAPQCWWDLESALPYRVEICWSVIPQLGYYDVLFFRHDVDFEVDFPLTQKQHYLSLYRLANYPLQSSLTRQLIPELRHFLAQTLPDYMVPGAFVPLKSLPLTPNGKVDRNHITEHYCTMQSLLSTSGTDVREGVPRSSTESTLANIWQDLLRLKQVSIYDNFFELGGHSLLATQMASRIRDAFSVDIPLRRIFEAPTIAQLAHILETLQTTTSLSQTPPLIRLDRTAHRRSLASLTPPPPPTPSPPPPTPLPLAPTASHSWTPLVPLALGGTQPPLFCIHPIFGMVLPYMELAHHLGGDRNLYGLQPLGLDGKHPPINQIEAMARYYIQAIQTIQPHGPYYLGGWSFGGLVAFEMAQQLTQAGESVALLAIFDTAAPIAANRPTPRESLTFLLKTALWSTLPFLLDYGAIAISRLSQVLQRSRAISTQTTSQSDWLSRWQWWAIARLMPEESRLRLLDESAIGPMLRIFAANSQAAYHYAPQPYPQPITLFQAMGASQHSQSDTTLGWNQLTPYVQVHTVPGNHLSMLKPPHVQTLAQILKSYL
ncbi:amino acid adenylation domain-containing protein [Leptolyngbya sp. PL-A3]|uniref:amino acid adenylation domain-containing protein n=1 Tax=Leptolyngbya sp. PL-A3 TaxID=2933911 RepID=UPI0032985E84